MVEKDRHCHGASEPWLPEASLRVSDTFWAYMAVSCWGIFRVNLLNLLENNRQRNIGFLNRSLGWNINQFGSVTQLCPSLCDPMDCSTPGFHVHHQLLDLAETHVHWVSDVIQPSHPWSSPSLPAFNPSQHQGLFQLIGSFHQMTKVLQLHHKYFQWIFSIDFL